MDARQAMEQRVVRAAEAAVTALDMTSVSFMPALFKAAHDCQIDSPVRALPLWTHAVISSVDGMPGFLLAQEVPLDGSMRWLRMVADKHGIALDFFAHAEGYEPALPEDTAMFHALLAAAAHICQPVCLGAPGARIEINADGGDVNAETLGGRLVRVPAVMKHISYHHAEDSHENHE